MRIDEIRTASDSFTDEVCTDTWCRTFINEAIAAINMNLGISLPLLGGSELEYKTEYLPNTWQQALFVNYVNYGVKMNDTSLNEADRYLQKFNDYLQLLKSQITDVVADEFLKPDGKGNNDGVVGVGGVYGLDTSSAIDWGWFSNHGRGGN